MQQVTEKLNDLKEHMTTESEPFRDPVVGAMQTVAEDWAKVSVSTFRGQLLDKALGISKAIAEFTAEMNAQ